MELSIDMERGKIDMAKDILAIDSPALYRKVRALLSGIFLQKPMRQGESLSNEEYAKTQAFINQFVGRWEDNRSVDEMVEDIYLSRGDHDNQELLKVMNQ